MNKIKIIELLNKIANGEKPTYIKYDGNIYAYNEIDDFYQANDGKFEFPNLYLRELNEEVEIIEEDKKIEKINLKGYKSCLGTDEEWTSSEDIIIAKINEIIDVINRGD